MFTPTHEQQVILDAVATGEDIIIEALAGTGKTSTSREIARRAPDGTRILALYFNKAARISAEQTFPRHNTKVTTTYAMANQAVRRTAYAPLLNKLGNGYIPPYATVKGLGISGIRVGDASIGPTTIAVAALQVLDAFCRNTATEITPDLYTPLPNYSPAVNEQLRDAVIEYAKAGWEDLLKPHGNAVQFEHQHYLKLWGSGMISDGAIPRLPHVNDGDIVIYDEAQDADPLMARIVAAQDHLQCIFVGDECQAINRFAGAVNAMRGFDAAHRLPLTKSWRFGPRVADAANVFLEALRSPHRVTGNPDRDTHVTDSMAADVVLCRTNAGTISEVVSLQEDGHKVAVVGGVREARRFAVACEQLQNNRPNTHPELSMFQTWDQLVEYVGLLDKPSPLSTVVKVVQQRGADTLIAALDQCVPEDKGAADVYCSTAHKSKGGEWNRVRMSTDFTVSMEPTSPTATDEDTLDRRDDQMLAYVAVTRAMESVNVGSLYDDRPAARPAVSIAATDLQRIVDTETARAQTMRATPQELADEFVTRLPGRLQDDTQTFLRTSGLQAHELVRRALASYIDMHAWG